MSILAPAGLCHRYGVPPRENGDAAYLTIKGVRDLTYGLLGLALIAFTNAHAVGWFMLVVALVPLGDTMIVLRHGSGSDSTSSATTCRRSLYSACGYEVTAQQMAKRLR